MRNLGRSWSDGDRRTKVFKRLGMSSKHQAGQSEIVQRADIVGTAMKAIDKAFLGFLVVFQSQCIVHTQKEHGGGRFGIELRGFGQSVQC